VSTRGLVNGCRMDGSIDGGACVGVMRKGGAVWLDTASRETSAQSFLFGCGTGFSGVPFYYCN